MIYNLMCHLHQLCVMPSVDHHTMDPLGVPQLGSSQKDLVWAQWHCAVVETHCCHEHI